MVEYWSDHADAPGDQLGNMKGMKNQLGNCRKRSSHGYIRLPLTVKFQVGHFADRITLILVDSTAYVQETSSF